MKRALILGASGLIGGHLLRLLLEDSRYSEVISISRKKLNNNHTKLRQIVGDLFDMNSFENEFHGVDDLFIAIGTTKAKTPDNETYKKIDYGIPVNAGQLAKQNGVKNISVVSSMGANSNSFIFYSKLKGKMEEDLQKLNFENLNIVRPSLLLGDRNENRTGESVGAFIMTKLDFMIPKKSKAIQGSDVAKAMVVLSNQKHQKEIWMNDELFDLVKAG